MSLSLLPIPSDSITIAAALKLSTSKLEILLLSASIVLLVSVSVPVVTKSCIWSPVANPVPPFATAAVTISNTVSPSNPLVIVSWFAVVVEILVIRMGEN